MTVAQDRGDLVGAHDLIAVESPQQVPETVPAED